MRILVTNDDGINAPGLKVLEDIARQLSDDVWTVAPETNQSGASHSLTLHEPLRCREVSERRFAVRGTPTDCVIMGVRHLLIDHPPDLVLSGVNNGSNLAEDVTYSGTIAGAIEGTLLGIRSIAMSLAIGFDEEGQVHWETPLTHGPGLVRRLIEAGLPPDVLINVNYPDLAPEAVVGVLATTQGRRDQNLLHIDERHDTWGHPYYWFGFQRRKSNPPEGTDLWAIYKGHISVTPLHVDLTHSSTLAALARVLPTGRPL
ncbi:MAG: 5'/3'-nucleotidase SurE [Hyphomicrobiaceae bacterium]|nr:5'/3'-nucleotidase SurE [Hyphomicrobiaceae bacterium]